MQLQLTANVYNWRYLSEIFSLFLKLFVGLQDTHTHTHTHTDVQDYFKIVFHATRAFRRTLTAQLTSVQSLTMYCT